MRKAPGPRIRSKTLGFPPFTPPPPALSPPLLAPIGPYCLLGIMLPEGGPIRTPLPRAARGWVRMVAIAQNSKFWAASTVVALWETLYIEN